jgi:hypothetical protein
MFVDQHPIVLSIDGMSHYDLIYVDTVVQQLPTRNDAVCDSVYCVAILNPYDWKIVVVSLVVLVLVVVVVVVVFHQFLLF